MTETEWLACTSPEVMLDYADAVDILTDRKQRLLECACVRRIWHNLIDPLARKAVEIAERFADDLADFEELLAVRENVFAAAEARQALFLAGSTNSCAGLSIASDVIWEYRGRADHLRGLAHAVSMEGITESGPDERALVKARFAAERKAQADLLRDVFGKPCRRVILNPIWLTWNDSTVRKIAQAIYDERAFDRMPILADALEDAGCDKADILNHCREPAEHVRGCWVLDLLLGKE